MSRYCAAAIKPTKILSSCVAQMVLLDQVKETQVLLVLFVISMTAVLLGFLYEVSPRGQSPYDGWTRR